MRAATLLQLDVFVLAAVHMLVMLAESLLDQLLVGWGIHVDFAAALEASVGSRAGKVIFPARRTSAAAQPILKLFRQCFPIRYWVARFLGHLIANVHLTLK